MPGGGERRSRVVPRVRLFVPESAGRKNSLGEIALDY